MSIQSIGCPYGSSSSTCNYCSPSGQRSQTRSSRHSANLSATRLSCQIYQDMINVGWRRSGTWCYKPDLRRSCCPQYTIKLDALAFRASRSQRKLINRWNRFVLSGNDRESMETGPDVEVAKSPKETRKQAAVFSLSSSIYASEVTVVDPKETSSHKFEVVLEPSSFTEEKYALFEKYQTTIHKDSSTSSDFKRFLVDSPLIGEPIKYAKPRPAHLPANYGSYHQLYRLNGELIAMGVIDILPACVSSVYFVYDGAWERFSLGKLSALREASLAQEIHDMGVSGMQYLYMGFYIYSCQKMRYKGQYSPSYLADPETYTWFPLSTCLPLLDNYRYACFSHPEHSLAGLVKDGDDETPEYPPLKDDDLIFAITHVVRGKAMIQPINTTPSWDDTQFREAFLTCVNSLGIETAKKIAFVIDEY